MAASPKYKVYDPQGEYVAACKQGKDAAALMLLHGPGSRVGYSKAKRATLAVFSNEEAFQRAGHHEGFDLLSRSIGAKIDAKDSAAMTARLSP